VRILFFNILFFISFSVFANGDQTGKVTKLVVHWPGSGDGKVDVGLTGPRHSSSPSGCNSGEWTIYLDNEAGKAQYSMLLMAASSDRGVRIFGNAMCSGSREVVRNVFLLQ